MLLSIFDQKKVEKTLKFFTKDRIQTTFSDFEEQFSSEFCQKGKDTEICLILEFLLLERNFFNEPEMILLVVFAFYISGYNFSHLESSMPEFIKKLLQKLNSFKEEERKKFFLEESPLKFYEKNKQGSSTTINFQRSSENFIKGSLMPDMILFPSPFYINFDEKTKNQNIFMGSGTHLAKHIALDFDELRKPVQPFEVDIEREFEWLGEKLTDIEAISNKMIGSPLYNNSNTTTTTTTTNNNNNNNSTTTNNTNNNIEDGDYKPVVVKDEDNNDIIIADIIEDKITQERVLREATNSKLKKTDSKIVCELIKGYFPTVMHYLVPYSIPPILDNQNLEVVTCLMTKVLRSFPNQKIGEDYLDVLLSYPISLDSIDVIHSLINGKVIDESKIVIFMSNSIQACEREQNPKIQARMISLLIVLAQNILTSNESNEKEEINNNKENNNNNNNVKEINISNNNNKNQYSYSSKLQKDIKLLMKGFCLKNAKNARVKKFLETFYPN